MNCIGNFKTFSYFCNFYSIADRFGCLCFYMCQKVLQCIMEISADALNVSSLYRCDFLLSIIFIAVTF